MLNHQRALFKIENVQFILIPELLSSKKCLTGVYFFFFFVKVNLYARRGQLCEPIRCEDLQLRGNFHLQLSKWQI